MTAGVAVTPATVDDRDRLTALLQLYAYDLSDVVGLDLGDDGRFRMRPVDDYFADPRRHAFFVTVDGKLAGFALVQRRSHLSGDESVSDVAEFFIMRKYRRRGVGERVAAWLFDRFPGPWEVRERRENVAATAFWRRAIGRYTDGRFDELVLDDARWRGPVQRFDSRRG